MSAGGVEGKGDDSEMRGANEFRSHSRVCHVFIFYLLPRINLGREWGFPRNGNGQTAKKVANLEAFYSIKVRRTFVVSDS